MPFPGYLQCDIGMQVLEILTNRLYKMCSKIHRDMHEKQIWQNLM